MSELAFDTDEGKRAIAATISAEPYEFFRVTLECADGSRPEVQCVDLADALQLVNEMSPGAIHVEGDDETRALIMAAFCALAGDDVAVPSALH